jgi:hypothetical protein
LAALEGFLFLIKPFELQRPTPLFVLPTPIPICFQIPDGLRPGGWPFAAGAKQQKGQYSHNAELYHHGGTRHCDTDRDDHVSLILIGFDG